MMCPLALLVCTFC